MKRARKPLALQLSRFLRAKRGELTLVQFARKLGVSKSSLSRMELGHQNVTLETLDLLCERFNCEVGELFVIPNDANRPEQ